MSCTFSPDGNWVSCCDTHDKQYSKNSRTSRKSADKQLRECVKKQGHPYYAKVMYVAVRAFGWIFYKGKG
jgi:hypothetical protein